jgi:hypothetical protein
MASIKVLLVAVLIISLIASGLTIGCGVVLQGSGNIKSEEYLFTDFNKIEISSAFEFEIIQSSSYSIKVTTDDNVIEKVRVTKAGDTLKIYLETLPRLGSVTLKTVIHMPQLDSLNVSGAAHGTINDFDSIDDVYIKLSGASKIEGSIIAGEADFNISGASIVRLQGSAEDMVANVSGASHFRLGDFIVNNANVNFSGFSTGMINVNGRLDANLSGASKLSYAGDPTMGTINVSGGSSLSKQ